MGPHGAPEFFTDTDIGDLLGTAYEVHSNSDRTGIRLIGPQPRWARADGGEGRSAPVEHPRHRVLGGCARLHR